MNRAGRRTLGRYGIGEQELSKMFDKGVESGRYTWTRAAFASAFLSLVKHFDFGLDDLKKLAVYSVDEMNNSITFQDLIDELKDKTGFDVDQPVEEYREEVE